VQGCFIGKPPCPRYGHTMNYLPIAQQLVVLGGRNDEICKGESIPYLNDLYVFSIQNRMWTQVIF
jgi:hypothetical protein